METNALIEGAALILSLRGREKTAADARRCAYERLEILLRENEGENEALRAHTAGYIYPALALYEGLKENGLEPEEAQEILRTHFAATCAADNRRMKRWLKVPFAYLLAPAQFVRYSRKHYSEEAGFGYRMPEHPRRGVGCYDMVRCPYVETFSRYGAPELCRIFCDSDHITYGDLHPKLRWSRTECLGYGDSRCDFCIRLKGKEE